jgi:hypothetical protein
MASTAVSENAKSRPVAQVAENKKSGSNRNWFRIIGMTLCILECAHPVDVEHVI